MTFEEWWLPKIADATPETPHGDCWCEEVWSDDGLVHIARAAWNAALEEATKVAVDVPTFWDYPPDPKNTHYGAVLGAGERIAAAIRALGAP